MLLVRAVRLPSLLLVFMSSQTGEKLRLFNVIRQSGENCIFVNFLLFRYRRSRVFLWLTTVDMEYFKLFDVGRVNIFCVSRVFTVHPGHSYMYYSDRSSE